MLEVKKIGEINNKNDTLSFYSLIEGPMVDFISGIHCIFKPRKTEKINETESQI